MEGRDLGELCEVGNKKRKGPERILRAFLKEVLASAYCPTNSSAVSSAMKRLTSEFGMGSGVPASPWTPRQIYKFV